jgi:hypothetical protein
MPKYSLRELEEVKGLYKFYELLIDGTSEFESFCDNLDEIYITELKSIYQKMNQVANLLRLSENKFRTLDLNLSDIKAFEIKSRNLRIYGFHHNNTGKIIVLGGYKKNQHKDLRKFKSKLKSYLDSL